MALGLAVLSVVTFPKPAFALVEGGIVGTVLDPQGVAIPNVVVKLKTPSGTEVAQTTSSGTGEYHFFGLVFGEYQITVDNPDFAYYRASVQIASGGTTTSDIQLASKEAGREMVLKVEAKRQLINKTSSSSVQTTTAQRIQQLPGGDQISLPRLLETTDPGIVQGPFNQTFIRGNHANVQYQIDGVQLPDSVSGTFAEAFSTRNIDHMEVITGGIPAEYGERLAAVVNIVTKSGTEQPGGSAQLSYGSYNTFEPQVLYGGSNASGSLHYFLSANYDRTDRGLDTPQPSGTSSLAGESQGTSDAVHDDSNGNSQFMKIDWLADNDDKISYLFYQNYNFYQIPNFPSSYSASDPYFASGSTDAFGNTNPPYPNFYLTPPDTNDTQANQDVFAEVVWKHTFTERSFLQVAPYWKYSKIRFDNDPTNDLAALDNPSYWVSGSNPSSLGLNHHVNNGGLKADYSFRPDDRNLIKTGIQLQASQANDSYMLATGTAATGAYSQVTPTTYAGGGVDRGFSEDLYAQDEYTLSKQWNANVGLRYTAFQFNFPDDNDHSSGFQFQPRVGVNFLPDELTKLHAFYGRLYMPAPLEDLRETFAESGTGNTSANFYDIKPEEDNYYEVGVDRQFGLQQMGSITLYYKDATNMLDDTQLLNTAIAAPYNYAKGYAYGIELATHGKIDEDFSDFFNYSYEIAKGENISGGSIGVAQGSYPQNAYMFLDHVQVHTANAGVTWAHDHYFSTVDGQFGSGLRTGPFNSGSLPDHFTFDLTAGYVFASNDWWKRWKVQGDVFNIFDNMYPITIANGFNGSHYAVGREFFLRVTKEL